jgi:hypothetical protein
MDDFQRLGYPFQDLMAEALVAFMDKQDASRHPSYLLIG